MKLLVERNDVEADLKDSYDETPLLGAAERGHKAVVQLLLERPMSQPTRRTSTGKRRCQGGSERARGNGAAAACEGRCQAELQGHGKVHKRTDAAVVGRGVWARGVMRLLLEKGADVDSKPKDPCNA